MKESKIIKIIGNMIFYLVLIEMLSISFILIKSTKEGKQPSIMGYKFYTVLTGSMEPTINVGDLIIVKDISPEEINVEDIITFGSDKSTNVTTHRVKEVLNEDNNIRFITQGDANNVQDPEPIKSDLLVGKVVKFIPKIGSIMSWIRTNLMRLFKISL